MQPGRRCEHGPVTGPPADGEPRVIEPQLLSQPFHGTGDRAVVGRRLEKESTDWQVDRREQRSFSDGIRTNFDGDRNSDARGGGVEVIRIVVADSGERKTYVPRSRNCERAGRRLGLRE